MSVLSLVVVQFIARSSSSFLVLSAFVFALVEGSFLL